MTFELEHIGLAAQDPAALKEWYMQILGATLLFEMPQSPPAFLLSVGGFIIEIYPAASRPPSLPDNRVAGWRHLALRVASLESARDHLVRKGIQFEEAIKPAGGGGKVLFFQDPEKNLLHLVERLPGGYC
jgi:catechol 2,3-dioxygenase-like lactoylglutathione lyase family enzyme